VGWFGGSKAPKSDWSALSTVIKAEAKLQSLGEITPSRRAGVIYRDSDDNAFLQDIETELNTALYQGVGATKTAFEIKDDDRGMRWIVLDDGKFDDLVSSVYTVGNAITANGAGDKLLAAVFELYFTGTLKTTPTDLASARTGSTATTGGPSTRLSRPARARVIVTGRPKLDSAATCAGTV